MEKTLTVCRVDGVTFAIDSSQVGQAIPRPSLVSTIQLNSEQTYEVIVLRGQIVPLVDLFPRSSDESGAPSKVIVLSADGRTLGVCIDHMVGIQKVDSEEIHKISHSTREDNLFGSLVLSQYLSDGAAVTDKEQAPAIGVLDVKALLQRGRLWSEHIHSITDDEALSGSSDSELSGKKRQFAMADLHGHRIGFDVEHLVSIETLPQLTPISGAPAHIKGLAKWRGVDLVVSGIERLMGIEAQTEARYMAVLEFEGRHCAVGVTNAHGVEEIALSAIQRLEASDAEPSSSVSGFVYLKADRVAILDAERLVAESSFKGEQIAMHNGRDAYISKNFLASKAEQATQQSPLFLVFNSETSWAIESEHVQEVVPFPAQLESAPKGAAGLLGNFNWRDKSIPVIDARSLTGAGGVTDVHAPSVRILVIRCAKGFCGLVVESLGHLIPQGGGVITSFQAPGGKQMRMVTSSAANDKSSYKIAAVDQLLSA